MTKVIVRNLRRDDLPDADRVNREAFGTFFGLEDPMLFRGDGAVVAGRHRANPEGAFAAEIDGQLVACGFVMNWGDVGIFGPLTVDVRFWGRGIARAMMDAMMAYMDAQGFALQCLFTHPQSATHIRLYEEYGFRMQRVTGVMDKHVDGAHQMPAKTTLFSSLGEGERETALKQCRAIANGIYPGLDLTGEILSIANCGFGDTLLIGGPGDATAFACCHQGAGSEAGSAQALIKFAAVTPGPNASAIFDALVDSCAAFAASRGVARLVAGTNTGRQECYEALLEKGFRTWMNGIAMIRPNDPGYNRSGRFVIDDWR